MLSHAAHLKRYQATGTNWKWFNFRKRRGPNRSLLSLQISGKLRYFSIFYSADKINEQNECYKWSGPHLNTFGGSKAINIKFSFCHFRFVFIKKKYTVCGGNYGAVLLIGRINFVVFFFASTTLYCVLCMLKAAYSRCLHYQPMSWSQCFLWTLIIQIEWEKNTSKPVPSAQNASICFVV